ncbi:MAG: hypothetical protein IT359_08850 [Gemmatimonadaceae bacterium]|nr:hypothetical protein [Gemmatimonadaceae bacterium]
MQRYSLPPGEGWRTGHESIVLRGAPPVLWGDVTLVNESDEKVKVRHLEVRARRDGDAEYGTHAALAPSALRIGARLAPRVATRARASMTIDPQTPPGRYTVDAEGFAEGGVVLEVLERVSVQLTPSRLELRGAPGDVLEAALWVSNRGNVPVAIPRAALVHLEEKFWMGRSLTYVLRDISRDAGATAFLDKLLAELKDTDIRPMRVDVESKEEELAAGASAALHLRLHLPEELRKGRDYVRSISFMHARLFVALTCDGSAASTKRRAL